MSQNVFHFLENFQTHAFSLTPDDCDVSLDKFKSEMTVMPLFIKYKHFH